MFKRYARSEGPAAPSIDTPTVQEVEAKARRSDRKMGATGPSKEESEAKARDRKRQDKLLDVRMDLHKKLLETLNLTVLDKASEQDLRREISAISSEGLREMGVVLNSAETESLIGELYDEVTGLGPLEPLLQDDSINDILVNSADQIFVERNGKLELTNVRFRDEKHLLRVIDKIVSAVLIEFGAFNEDMATYLQAAVATRLNIIVSGGTGSGKTTTLNALSGFIDDVERIVTIEDTAELQLQQVHVGRMESRPPNVEGKGRPVVMRSSTCFRP